MSRANAKRSSYLSTRHQERISCEGFTWSKKRQHIPLTSIDSFVVSTSKKCESISRSIEIFPARKAKMDTFAANAFIDKLPAMILTIPMMVGNIPERKKAARCPINSVIRENLKIRISLATSVASIGSSTALCLPFFFFPWLSSFVQELQLLGLRSQVTLRNLIIFTDLPSLAASVPWLIWNFLPHHTRWR